MGCVESGTGAIHPQKVNSNVQENSQINSHENEQILGKTPQNNQIKIISQKKIQLKPQIQVIHIQENQLIGVGSYLDELFQLVNENRDLGLFLSSQIFSHLETLIKNYYVTDENKKQLVMLLQQYIKFVYDQLKSKISEQEILLKNQLFIEKFSQQTKKLLNTIETKGDWILSSLYYFKEFQNKKFNSSQMKNTFQEVKKQYENQNLAMFYLSLFFTKYCQKLEKSGTSVIQINSKLKQDSQLFKNLFSVQNKRKQDLKQLQNMTQFRKQYYKRFFQQEVDKKFKQKIIKLQGDKKQQILEKQILNMVEFSKKNHAFFNTIVYDSCVNNEGFGFKSNLKLRSAQDKGSLVRVKQKLLKDKFKNYKKPQGCKNMKELRQKQEQAFQQQLKNIYNTLSQVKFTVSDLLRGKCLFSKEKCIYNSALSILDRVKEESNKGRDISIVQFDNRLQGITQDLVLKIRIQQLVCQFQLVLTFSQSQNAIHHKMYELVRSKILSPTTLLSQWNQKGVDVFIKNCQKYLKVNTTKQKQRRQILDKLIKFVGYDPNNKIQFDASQLKVLKNNLIEKIKRNRNQLPQALQNNRKIFQNYKLGNSYAYLKLIGQNKKKIQLMQKNYTFTNFPDITAIKNEKQALEVCEYYKTIDMEGHFKLLKQLIQMQKNKNGEQTLFYAIMLIKIGQVLLTFVKTHLENYDQGVKLLKKAKQYFETSISIFTWYQIEHQIQNPSPHHIQALNLFIQLKPCGTPNWRKSCQFKYQAFKYLKMSQKVFGKKSSKYAQALLITAQQLNTSNSNIEFYKKSLLILQNCLGQNHPDTLQVLYKMRKLYDERHKKQYWGHYKYKTQNLVSKLREFKQFDIITNHYEYSKFKNLIDPNQRDKFNNNLKLKEKKPILLQMFAEYQQF